LKRTWSVALALILLVMPVASANFSGAFLQNGLGARGMGMGGAFVGVADNAAAPFWNPAGLIGVKGKDVLAAYNPLSLDRNQSSLAFALNARGELAFGLGWLHAGVGDLVGRTASGVPTAKLDDNENAFFVGVARAVGSRLALGFTMKRLDHSIKVPGRGTSSGSGFGFDLGAQYQLTRRTTLGAVVRNLGASLDWNVRRSSQRTAATQDKLPVELGLGIAYEPLSDVIDLILAADLYSNEVDQHLNVGAEWTVNALLTLRGGFNRLPGDDRGIGSTAFGLTIRPMRQRTFQLHYTYSSDEIGGGARAVYGLSVAF